MTWTVWDVLITVIGVLHIAGIIGIAVLVMRIIKGPVVSTAARAAQVVDQGRTVAESALNALNANKGHVESIIHNIKGVAASVRPSDSLKDLPITYGSLRKSMTTLALVRQGFSAVQSFGKKKTAPPGPASAKARPVRVSIPERLGLVPPVAKHLIRLSPYLRIAKTVFQQMKNRP